MTLTFFLGPLTWNRPNIQTTSTSTIFAYQIWSNEHFIGHFPLCTGQLETPAPAYHCNFLKQGFLFQNKLEGSAHYAVLLLAHMVTLRKPSLIQKKRRGSPLIIDPPTTSFTTLSNIFSRPGRNQRLLYKQPFDYLIQSVSQ